MPRFDRRCMARWARRTALAGTVTASVFSTAVWGQSIPASVRACTLEPDSLKRLVCFDKEVARYTGAPAAMQGGIPAAPSGRTLSPPPPVVDAAPAPTSPPPPEPVSKPRHLTAHIVSIEPFPDALIVHLDNGQVWEQIQEASAEANLHTGDTVTIDREMGSYWLSGKNGASMKVRQNK